jgi:hypothetical protein
MGMFPCTQPTPDAAPEAPTLLVPALAASLGANVKLGFHASGCEPIGSEPKVPLDVHPSGLDASLADTVTAHAIVDAGNGCEYSPDASFAIADQIGAGLDHITADLSPAIDTSVHVDAGLGDCDHSLLHLSGCVTS